MTLRLNLVNLAWDGVSGSSSYDILLDGTKVAQAGPRARSTKINIPEGAEHKVTIKAQPSGKLQEAKFKWASVSVAPPPPPPPPPAGDLPAIIASGGVYAGTRSGTVQVRTTQPVTIQNSVISGNTSAPLLDMNYAGARVTVLNTTFNGTPTSGGVHGSLGRAIYGTNIHTLFVDHCTINYTWGIRVDAVQAGGSLIVRYCKGYNHQGDTTDYSHFCQSANNANAFTYEVAWNQCVGVFQQTQVEDVISIHSTHNAAPKIHDNYIEGAWPWYQNMTPQGSDNGSGIMVENSSHCEVYNNIVVATTNVGIGCTGGTGNLIHDNRCVSWGKTNDGQVLDYANVGIYCYAGTGGNQVYDNSVGWMGSPGGGNTTLGRNDLYLPFDGDVWYVQNTMLYPGQTITRQHELDEWDTWVAKLAAAGVTVGAT